MKPSASRTWIICGLLLLASAVNYMDRQALANVSVRITSEFNLTQEHYGNLEFAFGWAFAVGSLFFGVIVDRLGVRLTYPMVLLLWSAAGFATGLVQGYHSLLICRTLLGFFEAGHWPCGVKATQNLLEPRHHSMGNSVLQSGTSIGAIITPLVMRSLLTSAVGSWRVAFQIIGVIGLAWIVLWFVIVRKSDLENRVVSATRSEGLAKLWKAVFSRKMLVVLIVIALINTSWQLLRAWLPRFMQQGRGYSESDTLYFNSLFFVATDVGCLGAGLLTVWLNRKGMSVHGARKWTFLFCGVLSAFTLLVPVLPKGMMLLGILLVVGAGALGVFPIYHALTQDLSPENQGKVSGLGGLAAWILSPAQKYFGRLVDQTGSFDTGLAIAGCFPLVAFLALWFLWDSPEELPKTL